MEGVGAVSAEEQAAPPPGASSVAGSRLPDGSSGHRLPGRQPTPTGMKPPVASRLQAPRPRRRLPLSEIRPRSASRLPHDKPPNALRRFALRKAGRSRLSRGDSRAEGRARPADFPGAFAGSFPWGSPSPAGPFEPPSNSHPSETVVKGVIVKAGLRGPCLPECPSTVVASS